VTEDAKAGGSAPKINEFKNRFEKFGSAPAVTPKLVGKPPTRPAAAAAAAGGVQGAPPTTGNEAIDRACREARELGAQLQQQMTQLEQTRITERQQLVDKLERRDAEMKAINDKNQAVSHHSLAACRRQLVLEINLNYNYN